MELHDQLQALVARLGPTVLDDADGFRGALDDFLAEDAATTGDINLLVDAVRLGAYRALRDIVGSGATAENAVREAGQRLARDRGSADTASAMWAAAALGFAAGVVPDAEVRRHRSGSVWPIGDATPPVAPPAGGLPTVSPGTPPPPPGPPVFPPAGGPPPSQPGALPSAGTVPPPPPVAPPAAHASSAPTAHAPYASTPPGPPPPTPAWNSFPTPPPGPPAGTSKRRTGLVVGLVVAALAVIGIGVGAALTLGGDDTPKASGGSQSSGGATGSSDDDADADGQTDGSDEVDGGLDFASINSRYEALAGEITTLSETCSPLSAPAGQSEVVECAWADGTMTLTTYESTTGLEAARRQYATYVPGTVVEEAPTGVLRAFEESDDDAVTAADLYWDDEVALQSARLVAAPGKDLYALKIQLANTAPSIDYPTTPSNPELIDFADQWVPKVASCERIPSFETGESEENRCKLPGGKITVYLGRFESLQALRDYRKTKLGFAREDKRELRQWYQNEGDPIAGALYEFTIEALTPPQVVRYWDLPACFCYAEAYMENGSYERLKTWWVTG
ncbi:hypothetical protein [Nocardioides sp. R-C-SC26]|uniref:hypothetical protein n=1 Tax=Nocardioides sp. R-C-SC26 TaxID=2870414 RepID=UPI001E49FD21|nr:hypothetical protein [Nocardioides sp. R-C-SC26]